MTDSIDGVGRHYVPQRYLQNFEIPECPGFVWLHDKQSGKSHPAAIDKVAQSKGYYSDEVERALATDVEAPGNAVMAKLRQNDALSVTERAQMTAYMATMLKRVPYRRRKALEMLPGVLSGTTERIRQELIEAAVTIPSSLGDDRLVRRLEELDAAHAKFEKEPPEEVVRQIREPWPTRDMLEAIFRMTWRILVSRGPTYFWTTDNPVFFFESDGVATPQAEIAFPLSPTHALHGCWTLAAGPLVFYYAPDKFVREINRRLASTTERLAFSDRMENWMMPTLRKHNPYLSRFAW